MTVGPPSSSRARELTPKVGHDHDGSNVWPTALNVAAASTYLFSPTPARNSTPQFFFPTRSLSVQSTQETRQANRLNDEGKHLFERGQHDAALAKFDESLRELGPNNEFTKAFAVACCGKGAYFEQKANSYEAIQWFSKALTTYNALQSQERFQLHIKLASLHENLGETTSVLTHLLELEASPENNLKIARLYDELDNPEKALEHLQSQFANPSPEISDWIAALYQETGQDQEAMRFYTLSAQVPTDLLIQRQPLKSACRAFTVAGGGASATSIGQIHTAFDRVSRRFERFKRSVEAKTNLFTDSPEVAELWDTLGRLYESQGKMQEAQNCKARALEIRGAPPQPPSSPVLQARAIATSMSPRRNQTSWAMTELLSDLDSYKSSMKDKRDARDTLKRHLQTYASGQSLSQTLSGFVDGELNKPNNPIFSSTFGSNLQSLFLRAQNLIPRNP